MKNPLNSLKTPLAIALTSATLILSSCATTKAPDGAHDVRAKLTQLQGDPKLSTKAPLEIKAAEDAVREAEQPTDDKEHGRHLVWVADKKVDIAAAQAQKRYEEDQRKALSEERDNARLNARTQEVDALKQQIAELNAKSTDRGLVVTLGDVLFDTNKSDLKVSAAGNLGKLAGFLATNADRTVVIEGHTDNVGNDDYNQALSERRADAVKAFLISHGVAAERITAVGKGETTPVASNDSASGRQQNRRVEVIISNKAN